MTALTVRIGSIMDAKARFVAAGMAGASGALVAVVPSVNFASYDDMHKVFAPSRLAIVKALAGQGTLPIREVARRVDRDVQAVHRDVTILINAGIVDRRARDVEFPYGRLHFEYDVEAAARC